MAVKTTTKALGEGALVAHGRHGHQPGEAQAAQQRHHDVAPEQPNEPLVGSFRMDNAYGMGHGQDDHIYHIEVQNSQQFI